jgi:ribonuclease-3
MIKRVSNHTFKDLSLLETALTHSSFSKENYERLEFLGDSILDFVVGEYLYKNSNKAEGSLTKFRASFVSESHLSIVFDRLELQEYVKLGKSYKTALSPSIKADIIESLIAAVYLDAGMTKTKKFVLSIINIGNFKTMKNKDYKTQLQEFAQAKKQKLVYKILSKQGKSHNPTFEVGVFLKGELLEVATGSSKHKAEQEVAKQAIEKLLK